MTSLWQYVHCLTADNMAMYALSVRRAQQTKRDSLAALRESSYWNTNAVGPLFFLLDRALSAHS